VFLRYPASLLLLRCMVWMSCDAAVNPAGTGTVGACVVRPSPPCASTWCVRASSRWRHVVTLSWSC